MKCFALASSGLAITLLAGVGVVSCGPTSNLNQVATVSTSESSLLDEDEAAPLGLAGLGDRVCRLDFSFVKKDAAGNYSAVGLGTTTDGVSRTGFGRGCVNFCLTTFDELMKANAANNIQVLVNACRFAEMAPVESMPAPDASPAPAATAAATAAPEASPAPTATAAATPMPAATVAAASTSKRCEVEGGAGNLLYFEVVPRAKCLAECNEREQSNPQRKCSWGSEVLRAHPKNQCIIKGGAGKQLYSQSTTRFNCRMECESRKQTNPNRTCTWGGENVK
ncbi:MAG: hypothetical protein ACO3A4_08260 [Silvanigrellaceae bacterium]